MILDLDFNKPPCPFFEQSAVHPLFQIRSTLEKWQLLGFYCHRHAALGIVAGVAGILFDSKSAQPADLHAISPGKGLANSIKEQVNGSGGFGFGKSLLFVFIRPLSL
jgi:hypothetical protein